MPQRLYSSSDQPDFQTYPAPPDETARMEGVRARSKAPIVAEPESASAAGLERPRIDRFTSDAGVKDRVTEKVAELKQKSTDIAERASEYASNLKDEAMDAGSRFADVARENTRRAMNRSRELSRTAVNDYPLHVIAGAAIAGILLGIGLRAWRENRV
jgi:ElaB/YqjD/DUF883 family membrane-anchored ribosome-binding protein